MRKMGRNYARCELQKSSSQPTLNLQHGKSDGGVIGRYKKSVHTSIKGGK
jgi:hypothetical protein